MAAEEYNNAESVPSDKARRFRRPSRSKTVVNGYTSIVVYSIVRTNEITWEATGNAPLTVSFLLFILFRVLLGSPENETTVKSRVN